MGRWGLGLGGGSRGRGSRRCAGLRSKGGRGETSREGRSLDVRRQFLTFSFRT